MIAFAVSGLIPTYRSDKQLVRVPDSIGTQTLAPAIVELSFDVARRERGNDRFDVEGITGVLECNH